MLLLISLAEMRCVHENICDEDLGRNGMKLMNVSHNS